MKYVYCSTILLCILSLSHIAICTKNKSSKIKGKSSGKHNAATPKTDPVISSKEPLNRVLGNIDHELEKKKERIANPISRQANLFGLEISIPDQSRSSTGLHRTSFSSNSLTRCKGNIVFHPEVVPKTTAASSAEEQDQIDQDQGRYSSIYSLI